MTIFGRVPPLRVKGWYQATCHLSLEQKGLLIDVLDWLWVNPQEVIDRERVRKACRTHKTQFNRLWDDAFQAAVDELRAIRRPIDSFERGEVRQKTDGKCYYCDCDLVDGNDQPNSFHVDHKRPVVAGGSSHISNLFPACRSCNLSKGARHV